jgi:hypothetical protein
MRFLLAGPDHESNLSLGYLASSLRAAGHAAEIVAFNDASDAPKVLRRALAADAVGLSMCFQVRAPEFLELAAAIKAMRPALPIVAGGHFATCAAFELMRDFPQLDLVVQHEGERAIVELADLGDRMVSRKRPILRDLDSLPLPDRSGPSRLVAGVPTAYIMGSRGCIRSCDYCCITTLHRVAPGPRFRQREPEKVVEELAALYHERGVRQFVFHDDNFLVPSPKENLYRLDRYDRAMKAAGLKDIGIVMKCGPQDLDPASLEKLLSMGLLRIFLGIESGSQCGLDSIGRKQTTTDTERAVSLCEQHGVSSQYTMIIFNPDATIESMLQDLDFVERHPAHPLNYCRAEIYAGTPLERRMIESGNAIGNYMARTYEYSDPRVARVWNVGRDLFAGRCWGADDVLGQAIRLDHQATVLKHFYESDEAQRVARDFYDWEVRLNLDTARFFRALVVACGAAESDESPALFAAVASIREREAENRRAHLAELCSLRERISACVQPVIDLAMTRPVPQKLPSRAPRHALAVLVAAGLAGCGGLRSDGGVMEAPPPPLSSEVYIPPPPGTYATAPDGGAPEPDGGTPLPLRQDQGVAEAAPPPIPTFRHDQGVAEAAPPPVNMPTAVPPKKKP